MSDTPTKVLSRMLFGEATPTQVRAKINQVYGGSFAEIDIELHVTASVFSPERSSEELQDDIRRAVDEKYGVKGIPFLSIETGRQEKDGTGELLEDVLDFGNCLACGESLTSEEHDRSETYGKKCHNCWKESSN